MSRKTWSYWLLRRGRVPKRWLGTLEAEGISLRDEGIPVTVTFRNYREQGRHYRFKRMRGSGAIVLTRRRLAVFYARWALLNVRFDEDSWQLFDVTSPEPCVIYITLDVSALDDDRSGRLDIRLRTSAAGDLLRFRSSWADR